MSEGKGFEGWAIVELFGHRKLAGFVTEVEVAGSGMLRLDIPDSVGGVHATQYYNPSALYGLTPTTEETARRLGAVKFDPPVERWELPASPAREPAGPDVEGPEFDDDEEFDDGRAF